MSYDLKIIKALVDGNLPWSDVKHIMSSFKDKDRFQKYVQVLQSRVSWPEKILLPYGLHLYIVEKNDKSRVVKCDCGYEFGDYKKNWKLGANIFIRDTKEKMTEIYPEMLAAETDWMELREYYCPGCFTLLEVEALPPGYPIVFDFQPDIDAFYESWLKK
jgi:acetone carboxylase gamma subunit